MKTEAAAHYRVSVEEVPDELVASVTRSATFETVGTVVQEAFATLGSAVGAAAAFGENPPGLITLELRDEEMTLEIFMSISHTFDPPAGVSVRTLEGGSFATTVHEGPYDGVGEAYQALTAWIADQRRVSTLPPRERYLNDPHTGEVPRTRVEFPIA
jgi:effector-binding domain-containing protein